MLNYEKVKHVDISFDEQWLDCFGDDWGVILVGTLNNFMSNHLWNHYKMFILMYIHSMYNSRHSHRVIRYISCYISTNIFLNIELVSYPLAQRNLTMGNHDLNS